MATPPARKLQIVRILPAPPAEVYAAWTDPVQLARWFCPGDIRRTEATLDLRVGGRYHIVMHDASRATAHDGEYLELQPPTRLVFTWASTYTRDRSTRVTVELFPEGADRTRLVLTHEELPDDESRNDHQRGWTSAAAKLDAYLAAREIELKDQ